MKKLAAGYCMLVLFSSMIFAQENDKRQIDLGEIKGNVSVAYQQYQEDSTINAAVPDEKSTLTAFTNLIYTRGNVSAGVRYESYLPAQLGYPDRFDGTGLGYRFASYDTDPISVTVGNFYEQFGSGLVFRSYEERLLGIDNAMDGMRIKAHPLPGIYLKGIYGKQRFQFTDGLVNGPGLVRGFDGELVVNELLDSISGKSIDSLPYRKLNVIVGGSFLSKYQPDNSTTLILPENVGTYAGRIRMNYGKVSLSGEYGYKINDPSGDNGFVYKDGHAALLNFTYATKGFSLLLDAKTTDNFNIRSDRTAELQDLLINFSPALTKQHSYNLAATLYPYGSRPWGEVAYQAEVSYKVPKRSKIGGKYGILLTANFSTVFGLDTTNIMEDIDDVSSTRQGYVTNRFFLPGKEKYFQDFNFEIKKKFSKTFKAVYTYFNFFYNNDINQGAFDNDNKAVRGNILSQIHVLDLSKRFKKKHNIRVELQHLSTQEHLGNWATALIEYTYSPHWFVGLLDQYNYGNPDMDKRVHYLYGTIGYVSGAHRFAVGYGKQRAGLFCVGGVCRQVPASNGLTLTFTTSF
ncbi:MAG TPA: hypothetical protein DCF89_07385 [Flavobacteriales bacterium]|nr:hypothetical protein [Crocinitomicaceae bacterium]HAE30920.1 hypothetical protein [Flavobacteriales bacterium]